MQRNVPRCGAFASYDKDSQEEKEEGGVHTAEGAKQAQAHDDSEGWETGRDTARPDNHCGGSSAEVAIRLLAARSDEMVDAARDAILNSCRATFGKRAARAHPRSTSPNSTQQI